jgi:hypothetical protein
VLAVATEPTMLGECRLLHLTFEAPMSTDLLPPAVHPSIPYHVSIVCWDAPDSPYGPLRLTQVRLGCIVNILPRGLVTAALTDSAEFAQLLSQRYGMPARVAAVDLTEDGDRTEIRVDLDGRTVLDVAMVGSRAVAGGSAAVFSSISLANVEDELRLVQADFRMELAEPARGEAVAQIFDAAALGTEGAGPQWPVSAVSTSGTITLRPVRYVLDPASPAVVSAYDLNRRSASS